MTRRVHALLASCAVALAGTGCGSTDTSAYVRLPEAKAPSPTAGLERAVGELLGTDPEVSQAAEARLLALDPLERGREWP